MLPLKNLNRSIIPSQKRKIPVHLYIHWFSFYLWWKARYRVGSVVNNSNEIKQKRNIILFRIILFFIITPNAHIITENFLHILHIYHNSNPFILTDPVFSFFSINLFFLDFFFLYFISCRTEKRMQKHLARWVGGWLDG